MAKFKVCVFNVVKETEQAVEMQFPFLTAGGTHVGVAWFPKSQVTFLSDNVMEVTTWAKKNAEAKVACGYAFMCLAE